MRKNIHNMYHDYLNLLSNCQQNHPCLKIIFLMFKNIHQEKESLTVSTSLMCQYPGVDEKVPWTDLHGWDHNHRAGQVILAAVVAVTEKVRVESVVQVVCLLHGLVFLKQSVVVFAFLGIYRTTLCVEVTTSFLRD